MVNLKLKFIIFGFLLFGCNQTDNKNKIVKSELPADTANNQTKEQQKITDNENFDNDEKEAINNVIALFRKKNIDEISSIINFPLPREYPIPPIRNKKEFIKRFSEVFDQILINKVADSKIGQWSEVGWRGICLDDGVLWMAGSDGIITAINYQSDFEKKLRQDLIASEKESLYPALKNFESPTYKIRTKNYLIRIDKLTNEKYRYASWKIGEEESSKPALTLFNGEFEFEGSGGNHVITFVDGKYTCKVYRNVLGEDNSAEITLDIKREGKMILKENGSLLNI